MLGTRLIALGIVCLPAATSVASCSETAPATPRASTGSAPALLPNQGLQGPSGPDGIADDGSLITRQSTPSAPETISDEPPAASLVGDAGDPLTVGDAGEGVTDAARTDSNDDEDGVGESNSPTPITPSVGCAEQNPAPTQGLGSLMIRGLPAE